MNRLLEAATAARQQTARLAVDPSTRDADLRAYQDFCSADPYQRLRLVARDPAAVARGELAALQPGAPAQAPAAEPDAPPETATVQTQTTETETK